MYLIFYFRDYHEYTKKKNIIKKISSRSKCIINTLGIPTAKHLIMVLKAQRDAVWELCWEMPPGCLQLLRLTRSPQIQLESDWVLSLQNAKMGKIILYR